MAKKNVKKRNSPLKSLIHFIVDEKTQLITGLLLVVLSIIAMVAFVSYLFTWKTDYSFQWDSLISPPEIEVSNFGGKFGAYMAIHLISNGFGVAAFLFPFVCFIAGISLMKVNWLPFWKTFRVSFFLIIIGSVFISLLFGNSEGYLANGLGGKHGFYMANWLLAFFGKAGSFLVVIVCLFALIVFSFDKSLAALKNLVISNTFTDKSFFDNHDDSNQEENIEEIQPNKTLDFETEYINNAEEDTAFEVKSAEDELIETSINEKEDDEIELIEEAEEDLELTVEDKSKSNEAVVKKNISDTKFDPTLELSNYKFPSIELLEDHKSEGNSVTNEELLSNKNKIVETLAHYKIQIDKIKATIGPTITLYEIVPAPGIRISKIKNLEDDIALSLSALGIRIIAPIPGKGTIGIEVPNQKPEMVSMRSLISSKKFQESKMQLGVAMGKTISNETYVFDLAKMPHLLVAGATGQGKSVGLNVILTSLLYKKHPSQLKFVLIDPKKVELTLFSKIEKHFLAKLSDSEEAIITDTQKVIHTLQSLCVEMDNRYNLLKQAKVRNIKEYNDKFTSRKLNPENGHKFLPYIVVVIDEFADLIMTAGKEVETPLARLAQLARAIGIHLIIATQRPTTNIITGVIKANFPARIAFRVTSMMDSRTILDSPGANQLVGRGDMLFAPGSELIRLQCGFLDIPELEHITSHIENQQSFTSAFILPEIETESNEVGEVDLSKKDALFSDAARLVVIHQQGSTSLIQRKFSIGYNRAGRIIDQLEAAGIVGPFEGSKARQVLFPDDISLEQYLNQLD